MKFLIIGASGFIGSHLLRHVVAFGNEAIGTRSQSSNSDLLRFDLRTDRLLPRLPDGFLDASCHVVICSAISRIDRCFREAEDTRLVNVEKTVRLIDDVADECASVVFLSTSHAFDGTRGNYNEDDPPTPISEYGRQKVAVEKYLMENIPNALIVRLDKIVGDRPDERHLFSEWYELIQAGKPIRCIEGQVLSPTLVNDVASAIAMGCESALRGLFHISSPEVIPRTELGNRFVKAAGATSKVTSESLKSFGFADARPLNSALDGGRFIAKTGMTFTTMQETIDRFLASV